MILKEFSKSPYVTIGNHTDRHINLLKYNKQEISDSINSANEFLSGITSQNISSISYPHGFIENNQLDQIKELGFKIGITVVPGKSNLNELQKGNNLLRLKRTQLTGFINILDQCRNIHTNNFSLVSKFKSFIK